MFIKLHKQYDYLLVEENVHEIICGFYCKYHNDMCYKALVNNMIFMFSALVFVNTAMSCVVKLHRHYVFLFSSLAGCRYH